MSRRPRDLTPEQRVLVSAVKRVARQRARINATYVQEIVAARQQGITYAAIAQAAGTSSQAVQEIVRRHGEVHRAGAAHPEGAGHPASTGHAASTGHPTGTLHATGTMHPTSTMHAAGVEHQAHSEIRAGGSVQLGGIAAVTAPVEEVQ